MTQNPLIKLKLENVVTRSRYNKTFNCYDQFSVDLVCGHIRQDVLEKIATLNMVILGPLIEDDSLCAMSVRPIVKNILSHLKGMIPTDASIFGHDFMNFFTIVEDMFVKLCAPETIKEVSEYHCKYSEKDQHLLKRLRIEVKDDCGKLINMCNISDTKLEELVNIFIQVNQIVFCKYTSGLLLLIMTEFYLIFLDLEDLTDNKEALVINVLLSQFQKILYDSDSDIIILKLLCDTLQLNVNPEDPTNAYRAIRKFIKTSHTAKSLYPSLVMSDKTPKTDESMMTAMENMYNRTHDPKRIGDVMKICSEMNIPLSLDLFPYILHYPIPKKLRMKAYVKAKLLHMCSKDKRFKGLIDDKSFDQYYEQIYFPNRESVFDMMQSVETADSSIVINLNDFENDSISFQKIVFNLLNRMKKDINYDQFKQTLLDTMDTKE